jgi:hypothetical protein
MSYHKNAGKYGKYWNSIQFELLKGPRATNQIVDTSPLVGSLNIGNKQFELTITEMNRIIEELEDAKHRWKVAKSLGQLEKTNGTYKP